MVAGGSWEIVSRGTYRIVGSPRTCEQRAMALVLSAGPDAVVSHRAAAYLYGLDGFRSPGLVEITNSRHRRRHLRGARVHETLDGHLLHATMRRGIPVTGAARTVLDVCWVVDDDLSALRALEEMLRRRLVSWPELWECLVLHARRGRNGVARFRRVLMRRWGKRPPHGHFARTVQALLTDAGLPEPVAEFPVSAGAGRYRLDLAYPDAMLAVELDDKETHLTDKAFEEDPVRENRLKLAGWLVLRYTWERLVTDPNVIVEEVRTALRARSCAA